MTEISHQVPGIWCCLHFLLLAEASSLTGAKIEKGQEYVRKIEAFLLEELITIPSSSKTTQVCVAVPACAQLANHIPYTRIVVECIFLRSGEVSYLSSGFWQMAYFGMWVYFCWMSGLISVEKHMQSRLEPHPTPTSPACTIRKYVLPPIVAEEGSVLYICKCKHQVSLNNYQLEILLMNSWSYSSGEKLT